MEGDQTALDLLAMKTNRQPPVETATFFVGTDKGNVYVVTDKLRKICSVDDGIARLLHSYDHEILIVISATNMMTQYNVQQVQTQTETLSPTHSVRSRRTGGSSRRHFDPFRENYPVDRLIRISLWLAQVYSLTWREKQRYEWLIWLHRTIFSWNYPPI